MPLSRLYTHRALFANAVAIAATFLFGCAGRSKPPELVEVSPVQHTVPVKPSETATSTATLTPTPTATATETPTPTVTPTPTRGVGATRASVQDGMPQMFVPAGDFIMGYDAGTDDAERPAHIVFISAFWIDQTEVTNNQYSACVATRACTPPASASSSARTDYLTNPQFANYPVTQVSWFQAQVYCEWAGRRLPSEAEWEKAARGTDGRLYPWGNSFERFGNFFHPGSGDTQPVGSYPQGAGPYGSFDMTGNVWEWVADWYQRDFYSTSPATNPTGPSAGQERILRGGGWSTNEYAFITTFNRFSRPPSHYGNSIGFRCAEAES
jgi:serine/threonine-protein kinase